jgi:glucocorticoid receptor DNA-binding factor 1
LKSKKLTKKFILVAKISIFEQFLTLENVPIFFDKCIRYINAFGLTKEGVYRINGQKKNYTVLVEQSLSNYQTISNLEIYSYLVEDITSAVKLFLRTFSECLLTELLNEQWGSLSEIKCEQTRLKNITLLLSQMPKVNVVILKLLVAHLQ